MNEALHGPVCIGSWQMSANIINETFKDYNKNKSEQNYWINEDNVGSNILTRT